MGEKKLAKTKRIFNNFLTFQIYVKRLKKFSPSPAFFNPLHCKTDLRKLK